MGKQHVHLLWCLFVVQLVHSHHDINNRDDNENQDFLSSFNGNPKIHEVRVATIDNTVKINHSYQFSRLTALFKARLTQYANDTMITAYRDHSLTPFDGYGCYCRFYSESDWHPDGPYADNFYGNGWFYDDKFSKIYESQNSDPVDTYDELCQNLMHGYRCLGTDFGDSCKDPWNDHMVNNSNLNLGWGLANDALTKVAYKHRVKR